MKIVILLFLSIFPYSSFHALFLGPHETLPSLLMPTFVHYSLKVYVVFNCNSSSMFNHNKH